MPSYKFSFKFIKSSKKLLRMNAANIPSLAQIQKTLTWFSITYPCFVLDRVTYKLQKVLDVAFPESEEDIIF